MLCKSDRQAQSHWFCLSHREDDAETAQLGRASGAQEVMDESKLKLRFGARLLSRARLLLGYVMFAESVPRDERKGDHLTFAVLSERLH
ncbi:hypothetical protein Mapa_000282 [Marchantia paleacea]|nr:hypothetical protein Mapa_000282 [Marchantia paleacea]